MFHRSEISCTRRYPSPGGDLLESASLTVDDLRTVSKNVSNLRLFIFLYISISSTYDNFLVDRGPRSFTSLERRAISGIKRARNWIRSTFASANRWRTPIVMLCSGTPIGDRANSVRRATRCSYARKAGAHRDRGKSPPLRRRPPRLGH
jgi:hypothetical protein